MIRGFLKFILALILCALFHVLYASEVSKDYGAVILNVQPEEYRLYINNREIHERGILKLPAGNSSLVIQGKNHETAVFNLTIVAGDTLRKSVVLNPCSGTLDVRVFNEKVKCTLKKSNGSILTSWNGNGGVSSLKSGDYFLEYSYGDRIYSDTVRIRDNTLSRKEIQLKDMTDNEQNILGKAKDSLIRETGFKLSGGYSLYGNCLYNMTADVSIFKRVRISGVSFTYGLGGYYFSPYCPDDLDIFHLNPAISEYLLIYPELAVRLKHNEDAFGLSFSVAAGGYYHFSDNSAGPYFRYPMFYFCPGLIIGNTQSQIEFAPYTEIIRDEKFNSCDVTMSFILDQYLRLFARGKFTFRSLTIPEQIIIFAGVEMDVGYKAKERSVRAGKSGYLFIESGVIYDIFNDGFWSQGVGLSLYAAYEEQRYGRIGLMVLACETCMNANFVYDYEAMLRYDMKIAFSEKSRLVPSFRCGFRNRSYSAEIYLDPVAEVSLAFEKNLGQNVWLNIGAAVPASFRELKIIDEYIPDNFRLTAAVGYSL